MRTRRIAVGMLTAVAVGLAGWTAAGYFMTRNIEEPAYEAVAQDGDIEIRRYAPSIVAVTVTEGTRREALSEGFRRLAGFIFGKNRSQEKIAMTAPVEATPSEKIAMTAPVASTSGEDGTFRITFTMPAEYTLDTLPIPEDDRVTLEKVPSREVAALRFSGWATDAAVEEQTQRMIAWVEGSGRSMVGCPTLAQYDPPSTMPLFRRNEILVELAPSPATASR